ncbi:MAG: hypothetical protein CM15mP21_7540 [Hyphomicrobiales bacterium]|nr:MAG: hypothetical protein CM15mP21_7540 [Hyphomicrobiales bacterium]
MGRFGTDENAHAPRDILFLIFRLYFLSMWGWHRWSLRISEDK